MVWVAAHKITHFPERYKYCRYDISHDGQNQEIVMSGYVKWLNVLSGHRQLWYQKWKVVKLHRSNNLSVEFYFTKKHIKPIAYSSLWHVTLIQFISDIYLRQI